MKKRIITLVILVTAAVVGWRFVATGATGSKSTYQFAQVTRGSVENVVSGTGTLSAVGTVEVSTQVSGTLARVLVDYNDTVRSGQLLAELDTDMFVASVRDANANVDRTQAQLDLAESEYKRSQTLFQKGFISESDFASARATRDIAKANVVSAQASLERAEENLRNAKVYSPIDGTVIQRNVEEGQTVAASLQAPTLFVIAEDLARMEILGLVDESDIGQICLKQEARFTVQAYADETFKGTVRQIRLQPQTLSNVVNYTVVIDAPNESGRLLPGMTATVDFVVERADSALLVPNAALRYTPSQEDLADLREARRERMEAMGVQRLRPARPKGDAGPGEGTVGDLPKNVGHLWYQDGGHLAMLRVRTGVTNGITTEILEDPSLQEGMQVIKGDAAGKSSTTASTQRTERTTLGMGRPQGGPPPRMF
jgi:HlyD family secretion protein